MRALLSSFALAMSFAVGAAPGAFPAYGEPIDTPVVYEVETPFAGRRVVILQDSNGLSAAHRPYEGEESPLEPGSEVEDGPDALNWHFAGPRTGGRLAMYDLKMIEVLEADPLEPGVRYVEERRRTRRFDSAEHEATDAWSAADIQALLARGEHDRTVAGLAAQHYTLTVTYSLTTYDADGARAAAENRTHQQDLWIAPDLPFTPLQLVPALPYGFALSGSGKAWIDRAVLAEITPRLAALGGVVRTEQPAPRDRNGIEDPLVLEISQPEPTEPLDLPAVASAPVVPERLLDAVVGPLFISKMLQGGASVSPDGTAALTASGEVALAFDTGRSAWRVTPGDDFALAVAAGRGDGAHGLIVLLRPVRGVPAPGAYDTVGRAGSMSKLKSMDAAALEERTAKFQGFGLIERDGVTYVLTGFASGTVTIAGSGSRVQGTVDGSLNAVRIDSGTAIDPVSIGAEFHAVEGLANFSFRSPESRFVD